MDLQGAKEMSPAAKRNKFHKAIDDATRHHEVRFKNRGGVFCVKSFAVLVLATSEPALIHALIIDLRPSCPSCQCRAPVITRVPVTKKKKKQL